MRKVTVEIDNKIVCLNNLDYEYAHLMETLLYCIQEKENKKYDLSVIKKDC